MVTPDYQYFANRASAKHRDNTVICLRHASGRCRNRPCVARLPLRQTSTKAELLTVRGQRNAAGGRNCRLTAVFNAVAWGTWCYGAFAVGSSERLSITLSTIPKSRAISAVR